MECLNLSSQIQTKVKFNSLQTPLFPKIIHNTVMGAKASTSLHGRINKAMKKN